MLNVANRSLFTGDNLEVMRGLNADCIDLIYLDPPFNSNADFAAPIGSEAAGAAFKDTRTLDDVGIAWHGQIADDHPGLYAIIDAAGECHGKSMKAYLIMMGIRLLEMKRLLKPTGSIYLHCDPIASHYLKMVMDAVFGTENFRNEIIWRIGWVSGYKTKKRGWIRNHDVIIYYVKTAEANKQFNKEYIPYPVEYRRRDGKLPTGQGFPMEDTWNCHAGDTRDSIMIKSFSKEKTGYPTQKPLKLLERIIKASSLEGQVVLDPFCGCATACLAAEHLQREWIGIDLSEKAADLVRQRLTDAAGIFGKITHRIDIPVRTDIYQMRHYDNFKNELYGRQEGRCNGCKVLFPFRNMTVDHIVPRSGGGQDNEENLQLLCGACNSQKGDRPMAYLIAKLKEMNAIGSV